MTHYFQSRGAGIVYQPSSIGGMGYALPAAMAAKLASPERDCVAVCGDGGFADDDERALSPRPSTGFRS